MADADIVQSFNSGIEPGLHTPYTQVHVLLIHWEVNDLEGVEDEVQRLRDVFRTKYNYNSVIFRIPTDKSCRIRLNKEILGFVENQSQRDGLIIVYYAGHCGPGDHGQAEWAAFEDQKQPKLSWNEGQQLLFSAPGDVLLILDCCNASLIALGSKDEGSRFELIAASAKDGKTPVPGTKSFTTTLTKLLKLHADEGISSENLSSELREHRKITETPVFHNFVRKSPTSIQLQRLSDEHGFMTKPSGYLWFRVSLSGDVTGTQIAEWLKSAPPKHATAVRIEAIVSRARRIQEAFPKGSVFQNLSQTAREEIESRMRGLDTVMAAAAQYAKEPPTIPAGEKADAINRSFDEIEETVSTVCTAIETPLLLDDTATKDPSHPQDTAIDDNTPSLLAAADVGAALDLRQAILNEEACLYTVEISYKTIAFKTAKSRGGSNGTFNHSRFKYGTLAGQPVIMETYEYKEANDFSGEPQPQTLHQARRITGLLRHPKRTGFHILPCAGFFWNRGTRNEMGLVFDLPPAFDPSDGVGVETLLELYKMHKLVPLGHRIHLAWAMTTAIEHFHRVGWVHKSIRSNNIAFAVLPKMSLTREDGEDENSLSPTLGDFDLGNPLLFGFEYSRAGDAATYLEEDHSRANNLYRIPERWNKPTARFKKSHDVYSLGVVLFEIALWKDIDSALKSFKQDPDKIAPSKVTQVLKDKCVKMLPHQVGAVLARCILTCLDFDTRTKGLSEYEMQRYFQRNIVEPMGKAVQRI